MFIAYVTKLLNNNAGYKLNKVRLDMGGNYLLK